MRRWGLFIVGWILLAGCASRTREAAPARPATPPEPAAGVQFRLAESSPKKGTQALRLKGTAQTVYLHKDRLLDETDILSASARRDLWLAGKYDVLVSLTPAGAKKLEKATSDNIGKQLGVVVAGRLITVLAIEAAIRGGEAVLGGGFTEAEANRLVAEIAAAAGKKGGP